MSRRIHPSRALPLHAPDLQLFHKTRIYVAVYADFFPVAYESAETGRFEGLDIDLLRGFSVAMGLGEPRFVRTHDFWDLWEKPGAWDPKIDVAVGGISRTDFRNATSIEWTLPYFRVQRTIVYRRADPIMNFPDDVHGIIRGTPGSTGMGDLFERLHRAGKRKFIRFSSGQDGKDLEDLLAGRIQGLMRGSFVGAALVRRHPDQLAMMPPWEAEAPHTWGPAGEVFAFPCRRGSGLAALLNAYLLHVSASGELAALVKKHDMDADI